MTRRLLLRALADRLNIHAEYVDHTGASTRFASDEVTQAVVALLGYDGSSEDAAADSIRRLDEEQRAMILDPVVVLNENDVAGATISVQPPQCIEGLVAWHLELTTEENERLSCEGSWNAVDEAAPVALPLPGPPSPGYHTLRLVLRASDTNWHAKQRLIVAPRSCIPVRRFVQDKKSFGLCANLYTLRSARNWGVGDTSDLTALCRWIGQYQGAFVGVNPLHALRNTGRDFSPYDPVSRLCKNAIYLDLNRVPELERCPAAREEFAQWERDGRLVALRNAEFVDYESIWNLKLGILRLLHETFTTDDSDAADRRRSECEAYAQAAGRTLHDFAVFMALESNLFERGYPRDWRQWPLEFQQPDSPAVREFANTHANEVSLWKYLQFELDRQIGDVSQCAKDAGMAIGLYQDLALGSQRSGADTWAHRALFVEGASVGSPPDDFCAAGQNWGFPPMNPRQLQREGFDYWIQLVRSAMAHAGALRIDHMMGLFRRYWIPDGLSEGAYVSYPSHALLSILALESHRNNALIIGEDLGTVPPGFSEVLSNWNILSCRLLYFEQAPDGSFRSADQYSDRALVSFGTHDHPPLACFWHGRDIELRRTLGNIESDDALEVMTAHRARQRTMLIHRLQEEGLIDRALSNPSELSLDALRAAVHEFLLRTPAPLVAIMLDDLALEGTPVNIPGVGSHQYPVWARRMRCTIEQIARDPTIHKILSSAQSIRNAEHTQP